MRPAEFPSRKGYALVTGGAVRIGAEICRRLARDGWAVAIHYRNSKNEAEALAVALRAAGARACTTMADLESSEPQTVFDGVDPAFGFCSLLVNSAAGFAYDDIGSVTAPSFDAMLASNLRAPVLLARRFRELLPEGERGLIVNLLDQKVFNLNPDFLSYTLSKTGLESATRLLAMALAPDIRVCGVAPGLSLRSGEQTEEGFESVHGRTPLGFGSRADDVAETVAFLTRMPAMTGTTVLVDGGQSLVRRARDVMFSYGLGEAAVGEVGEADDR
jgi:NAD(P)-dependent dehydrogenase (short-subunit alcohol dehydrogenase family)